MEKFLEWSAEIYVVVGAGYIAYLTAFAGLRGDHRQIDTAFFVLAFGLPALLIFRGMNAIAADNPAWAPCTPWLLVIQASASVVACTGVAALWRGAIRRRWLRFLRSIAVHVEDGAGSAWVSLVQRSEHRMSQVTVHRKSGPSLHCAALHDFETRPYGPCLLGPDGSIALYVTHLVGGSDADDGVAQNEAIPFEVLEDDFWGVQMTYVPASEISSVDIRLITSS